MWSDVFWCVFFLYHPDVSFYIKLEIKSSSYIILMFTSSTPLAIFDNKIAQWCSQITTTLRTTPPRPPRSHSDIWRERKDRDFFFFLKIWKLSWLIANFGDCSSSSPSLPQLYLLKILVFHAQTRRIGTTNGRKKSLSIDNKIITLLNCIKNITKQHI